MTLREALVRAQETRTAIPHFNVSDSNQLNALARVAQDVGTPLIIGTSEGERSFIGAAQVAALVRAWRESGVPLFLNADHTHDLAGITACIDAGFDAVLFDGSKLSMEENIEKTRAAVAYARASGRDVLVEGELGYIGSSSKVLTEVPEGAGLDKTTPEDAARFVRETGVDLLAPSVGNIHGMLKDVPDPSLDVPRVEHIAEAAGVPLVLHGASGNSDADIAACIAVGVRIVHINTEIRVAYRDGIRDALAKDPEEVAPYKYLGAGAERLMEVAKNRALLFTGKRTV